MNRSVKVCIIPAAGDAKRWYPISKYLPKEMLPLNKQPAIEYVIKEAAQSGCQDIIIIINHHKEMIKDYLLNNKFINKAVRLHFLYQNKPKGVAEAMFLARKIVGDRCFALLFPDLPSLYKKPPLLQLISVFKPSEMDHLFALARYPENNSLFYGEFLLKKKKTGLYDLLHLCPKANDPSTIHHPETNLRGAARNIYSPKIWPILESSLKKVSNTEVSDGDVINLAFKLGQKFLGFEVTGKIFDIGTPSLYAQANREFTKS